MNLSIADFTQRYQGTYVLYTDPITTKTDIVFIAEVADEKIYLEATNGVRTLIYPKCFTNFNLDPPQIGYFEHRNYGLYVFRNTERQWKRGLCRANTEIYNPFHRFFLQAYTPSVGYQVAHSILKPRRYPSISNAIEALLTKKEIYSCPISPNLLVSKSPVENTEALLWYGLNPVALYQNARFAIRDETFEQEIQDELRDIGASGWII